MGHNFDIILPEDGWFSSKLNKTYCNLVNFYCKKSENGSIFVPALVCGWVKFPILWLHTPLQMKLKCPPPGVHRFQENKVLQTAQIINNIPRSRKDGIFVTMETVTF